MGFNLNLEEWRVSKISSIPLSAKNLSQPAESVMRVRCPLSEKTIKIFDISGKLIKEIVLLASELHNNQEREMRVSLKGINPGIYFLQLGKATKKFMVVK
uniref:T9SS type A sorting domain-containing protein n=1 Tax=candidate division WOR-3 bacterium TaxID=2052148 RepID=A0A7C6A8V4_UNCW3